MKHLRIPQSDWERVYEDWAKSGLNKSAYVRSERYKALFAADSIPTCWAVAKHLRKIPRFGAAPVPVTTLNESDIARALNREPRTATASHALRPLQVVLGNGARIEFESPCPEQFALQALLVCGGQR